MASPAMRPFVALLAATAVISIFPGVVKSASQDERRAAVPVHRSIANGVYFVLHEGTSPNEAETEKAPHFTLVYNQTYSESDRKQPPRYVALDSSSFVPLILAGPPELDDKEYRGHPMLKVSLAPGETKRLEDFTRAHLGGTVAVVVDREIVTIHKVRSVIQDGRVQISRCEDDACRVLRMKLAK